MKKSIGRKIKKIVLVTLLSTVVATFAATAISVAALPEEYVIATYSNFNPLKNRTAKPTSLFECYYEAANSSRNARAGTHYHIVTKQTRGAYVNMYYINNNGRATQKKQLGLVKGKNCWLNTPWVSIPNDCKTLTSVEFCSASYINGQMMYVDIVKFKA